MVQNLPGVRLGEVQLHPVPGDVGGVAVAGQVGEARAGLVAEDGVVGALAVARSVGSVAAHLDLPEGLRAGLHELIAVPALEVNHVDVGAETERETDRKGVASVY